MPLDRNAGTSRADRLAAFILRNNWRLAALVGLFLLVLAAGLPRITFSSDNSGFLGSGTQEVADIEHLDDTYAATSLIMVMVVPPPERMFAPETLTALRRMTEDAWFTPNVLRVESPTNYVHSYARNDEIFVEPILPEEGEITEDDAERFRQIAPGAREMRNYLLSEDLRAYGIAVSVVPTEGDGARQREIADFLSDQRDAWLAAYPDFRIRMTGPVLGNLTLAQAARQDAMTLVPLALALVIGLLVLFLPAPRAVATASLIVVAATVATFGFVGWAGIALTAGTAISPLSVMVLTSASCVHLSMAWIRAQDDPKPDMAVHHALSTNLAAVTVTLVTTSIGFLGLNFAQSPPLREMGNVVAFGLLFALFLVLIVMPLGLRHARAPRDTIGFLSARSMLRLADAVIARQRLLLTVWPVLMVLAVLGTARIGVDDNLIRYFGERFEFRQESDEIRTELTGLDNLQFSFRAPEGTTVFDPDFLRAIDRFAGWLEAQDEVVAVASITDIVKRINRSMNNDDDAALRIADTREANAQLMMFYELSLPVGLDLNTQIDVNRTETRVVAVLRTAHSQEIRDLAARSDTWMAQNIPAYQTRPAGPSLAFARITEANNLQMLYGLGLVLALISLILIVALRSVATGLISLVPNLVPALMGFGLWGMTFQDVNLGSSVVTTMTFGIVVDDTVHFLMHYLRHRRAGLTPEDAMRRTFTVTGAAIIMTSFALIGGFAVMATSGFVINQHIGALTAIVIGFALLADLLLLPPVLLFFERLRT